MRCVAVICGLVVLGVAAAAQGVTPWTELYRVTIPDELPDHPRVFCTQADIDRIKADYAAGDAYTRVCVDELVKAARGAASATGDKGDRPTRDDFRRIATLAQAYAVTGEASFGRLALEKLLHAADVSLTLEPTRARGLFTGSTLSEGPVAVDAAWAWDLIANAAWVTDKQRAHIEDDLLRRMGRESGHRCAHANSSNWRSWALAIVASCGFATGDRELIDEAVNGAWDHQRNIYLYGAVQQIAHSIFADGIHWERSVGYTYYTLGALQWVLLAAENSGVDLWHAEIPGILGPFEGGAHHEEFGPPGPRSIKYTLDALFYQTFPDMSMARINDSGTRNLGYHPIYELAWERYGDPKYAWLLSRQRGSGGDGPGWWSIWRPQGEAEVASSDDAHEGAIGWRMKTGEAARAALVQDVVVPADRPATVSAWVKALTMDGGSAHIRCNTDDQAVFSDRVTEAGDWRRVECVVPAGENAAADQMRRVRIHLFLEGGAGEVVWDDIEARVPGDPAGAAALNYARNPSFEAQSVDGRRTDFFSLLHAAANVPEGHFSLAEDATIGLVGLNRRGCTNFPIGGFTLLRGDPLDLNAPAVEATWGPYGSGHDHPDRLAIVVYGQGRILCPDAGSWGYENPMHLTWANQTIAHNTLTVDEVAQKPQGMSNSIWAGERDTRVFGVQRLFYPGEQLKAARFTCDTAYDGVTMDRTVCLVGGYLADVFRATSAGEHLYDLALHGPGEVSTQTSLTAAPEDWLSARGYEHLANVRRGEAPEVLRVTFATDDASLLMLQATPVGAQVIVADDPVRKNERPTSCVISRVRGTQAAWVSVLEPFEGRPTVSNLQVEPNEGGLRVVIAQADGSDELFVPTDPAGAVELRRMDADGAAVTHEEAQGITGVE